MGGGGLVPVPGGVGQTRVVIKPCFCPTTALSLPDAFWHWIPFCPPPPHPGTGPRAPPPHPPPPPAPAPHPPIPLSLRTGSRFAAPPKCVTPKNHERSRPHRTYPMGPASFVIDITDYLFLSASQSQD